MHIMHRRWLMVARGSGKGSSWGVRFSGGTAEVVDAEGFLKIGGVGKGLKLSTCLALGAGTLAVGKGT